MLVKRQQNSTDTAHTEASLSWWCFLPAWLFALAADWVLVQICLYAYLSSMKAAVTLGRILSTWPASCGVRILRREDLQHFTDMSLFACWRFGSGLTRFHLKDQWNCEKIPVAKLLFPSVNWKSGVPSPTVSWSSETLHKSRILAGLFFFSVQAWPTVKTHQWLCCSFPRAAGFTLFCFSRNPQKQATFCNTLYKFCRLLQCY